MPGSIFVAPPNAVRGKTFDDLVRIESVDAEANVRPESFGTASFDQRDELRTGSDAKDGNRRSHIPGCSRAAFGFLVRLQMHIGQLQIPFECAPDNGHGKPDVVQRAHRNGRRVTRLPIRLCRSVAHITQKSAPAAGDDRIELERESVRVIKVDAVDGFPPHEEPPEPEPASRREPSGSGRH